MIELVIRVAGAIAFLIAVGWIYMLTIRLQHLADRADQTFDNSDIAITKVDDLVERLWEAYAAYMTPAEPNGRAREAADELVRLTEDMGLYDEPEPTTEPIRRQGTDTQPEAQAVGTAADPWVAQEMARIMAKLGEPAKGDK